MKQTVKVLILLIAGLIFFASAASAESAYAIDESSLLTDGTNYYIFAGTNLTLPVSITYTGNEPLAWMVTETNVTLENVQVTGLSYDYVLNASIKTSFASAKVGKEHIYEFTGSNLGVQGTVSPGLTINVTGLTAGNTYEVKVNVYAGNPESLPTQTIALSKPLKVYTIYQGTTETNVHTAPKWNMTTPLQVNTSLITADAIPAGTYTIPWETYEVTRGNGNFSLAINKTTTTPSVLKQNDGVWAVADASTVTEITENTLTLTLGEEDENADAYQIMFVGRCLGDVVNGGPSISGNHINIFDTSMILLYDVSNPSTQTAISPNFLIYGDAIEDGKISMYDAQCVFWYHNKGMDNSVTNTP